MPNEQVIGIIGAMESEVKYLREQLVDARAHTWMGMEVYEGLLNGAPVALVRCGIGKVNAALCAQVLVAYAKATCIINTGVAGSLDANINIGDILVSTDAVEHDFDVTPLGYAPGEIPGMETLSFACDEELRKAAVEAVSAVAPEVAVFEGRVASGDQFVASAEQKDRIVSQFGAVCCEMEGAAMAHACSLMHVPCVIVRAISDKADGSAHMDYPTFEEGAAQRCARIVEHMVQHL